MLVPLLALMALFESALALAFGKDPKKGPLFAVAACGSSMMVFVLGAVGTLVNRGAVEQALASIEPSAESRMEILYKGHLEARQASFLALVFGVLPLVLAVVAVLRSRAPSTGPELSLLAADRAPPPNPISVLGFGLIGMALFAAVANVVLYTQPIPGKQREHREEKMIDPAEGAQQNVDKAQR